ncbi:hypothetical protein V501_07576 [Pseudogymnoascus sp. VKM F-4519 (FW-2642)]|nr:hypothetical protein V501_07576 [Pseudogymnoascus sp. VKM F-4519 (FW-2642)]
MFTLKNALVAILALAGVVTAVPLDGPVSVTIDAADVSMISERSGCSQGACPDNNASFDFMIQFWQNESVDHNLAWFIYKIRVNDCGQCVSTTSSYDGCVDFTSCGRQQSICVDKANRRSHRIWKDLNHKTCYADTGTIWGACGFARETDLYWPVNEVACNW